jgi:hypothetical protein
LIRASRPVAEVARAERIFRIPQMFILSSVLCVHVKGPLHQAAGSNFWPVQCGFKAATEVVATILYVT